VAVRASPLAQFGIDDPICICPCGVVAYLLGSESLGGKEENGLGSMRVVREIHLEITQAVPDSAIEDSAFRQAHVATLFRLAITLLVLFHD
jgi:hypothetical protein